MMFLLLACTGAPVDDTGTVPFDGAFVLTDANNYNYTSAITADSHDVELGTDFSVDWSGLDTDIQGHAMDPATDTDLVWLVHFALLSQQDVLDSIASDTLLQQDVAGYAQFHNQAEDGDPAIDVTSANLSQFVAGVSTPFDPAQYFTDPSGAWLLRITTGTLDTRMLMFVNPSSESTNHAVTFTPTSAVLDFDADLHSLTPFTFDTEPGSYTADWSALTTHANGNDLVLATMDQLMLARYDGMTLDDLESDFINVESIASEFYTTDVYGKTSTDLSAATTADGTAFSGFGTHSLWLLGLRCTACANPSPPFLTVVEVGG